MARFEVTAHGVEPSKIPEILVALAKAGFRDATFYTTCKEGGFTAGDLMVRFDTDDLAEFVDKLNALMAAFEGYTLDLRSADRIFLSGTGRPSPQGRQ